MPRTDAPAPGNTADVTTAPANWPDVERLFGGRGEPSRCWCRWFTLPGAAWKDSGPEDRRQLLHDRFGEDLPEPGVLAFRNGVPVGWCAVEPRECYPRITASRLLRLSGLDTAKDMATDVPAGEKAPNGVGSPAVGSRAVGSRAVGSPEVGSPEVGSRAVGSRQESVWSVSCFVVAPSHRRTGVAAQLLQAAVEHAFANGATVVEGYPVVRAERPKAGPADLYQGTLGLFTTAGFKVEATPVPGRAVVRLTKDAPGPGQQAGVKPSPPAQ